MCLCVGGRLNAAVNVTYFPSLLIKNSTGQKKIKNKDIRSVG